MVDPGDAAPVMAWLEAHPDWTLNDILITHHHFDHVGGVEQLKTATGARVAGPAAEKIPARDIDLKDNDAIDVLDLRFEVMAVPGHTLGHIAYYHAEQNLLFCGDTLFSLGCGRMFEGSAVQMHASLARLAALPEDTLVCCAHEYTLANAAFALTVDPDNPALQARVRVVRDLRTAGHSTLPVRLAEEIACNPFLRCGTPALHIAAEHYSGQPIRDADAVFATLRGWKDRFRG